MSSDSEFSRPADTMRKRVGESRVRLWLLITANRWFVTAGMLLGSFLLLLALEVFGPTTVRKLTASATVSNVFGSVIIATVTSVTLVLTISQLVLSQEIGPLGEQRERMRSATEFREDLEETAGFEAAPAAPSHFLRSLLAVVEDRARTLLETVDDEEFPDVAAYADGIVAHSDEVRDQVEGTEFGSFETLLPVLNYNYSWKIAAARSLRASRRPDLPDEADDALGDLVDVLRYFGPAREHFKTLYFQWEVVNISRAILYGAMPTLMLSGYMVFVVDPTGITGTVGGFGRAYLFVSAAYVLSLLPFAVLLAYLLRLLTVAKRTLAMGPFILRDTEHVEQLPFDEGPE